MTMEFRAWITVPGLDVESDAATRLLATLDDGRYGDIGPVLSGSDVVVSTDAPDEAEAAGRLAAAVGDALHIAGLGALYPARVALEPIDELAVA